MRRREEDDPFMASGCDHAQSELTCIANKKKACKYPSNIVLIALLFQENKSFGASTICIHPLMYVKPCREQGGLIIYNFCFSCSNENLVFLEININIFQLCKN
jgi:hypothetical protein